MHHHLLLLCRTDTEKLSGIRSHIETSRSYLGGDTLAQDSSSQLFGVETFNLQPIELDIKFLYELIEDIVALSH
jgi:hypothetical protein